MQRGQRNLCWSAGVLLLVSTVLASCSAQELPQPEEIHPEDICDNCRMAITDSRYAAEIVTARRVWKFDDFGCMVSFEARVTDKTYAAYVKDYETRRWLPVAQAVYVLSEEIPTPMEYGIVALADREQASAFAASVSGKVLDFSEARNWVEQR